jgi:hypothetical protein
MIAVTEVNEAIHGFRHDVGGKVSGEARLKGWNPPITILKYSSLLPFGRVFYPLFIVIIKTTQMKTSGTTR